MTTTWNANKPAIGDTIAADIPDIQENFLLIKDILEAITSGTLGTTGSADFDVDVLADAATMTSPVVTTGFNDGTQAISWPTNGMAAAKFMLGNSNTIAWFYLNTAPPGWKVLATGADKSMAIAGGAGAWNVNGGNIAGTSFDNLEAHTHEMTEVPNHVHVITALGNSSSNSHIYLQSGNTQYAGGGLFNTANPTGGVASATTGASSVTEDRPTAAVGRLYQLDTA